MARLQTWNPRGAPCAPVAWLVALAVLAGPAAGAPRRALFDNTHAETAGNADWVIDTDQPLPVPDQATVTAATPRTYWLGGISSWGIDLVKRGYSVATLTSTYGITFGSAGNPYDLSNFDVFIVPEPNTVFSAAESTAIFNFVRDGGGLVAVADHINSDRNGDGIDSPRIWNKLDAQRMWGTSFDVSGSHSNFTEVWSTNVSTDASDSTIYGPEGTVNGLEFHNGAAMTLYPALNPTVRGSVWRNTYPHGTTAVMAAHSVYGNGRIFFVGDSSPVDDGSAAPGNSSIFDGWAEAAGGDSLLLLNATAWATRRPPAPLAVESSGFIVREPYPNPFRSNVHVTFELPRAMDVSVDVFDVNGRHLRGLARARFEAGAHDVTWDGLLPGGKGAPVGLYFVRARIGATSRSWRLMRVR